MSQDEYYNDTERRIDTLIGGNYHIVWREILNAKKEFSTISQDKSEFAAWLNDTYGIKLKLNSQGMLDIDRDITDEQKYLIFLLKHGE